MIILSRQSIEFPKYIGKMSSGETLVELFLFYPNLYVGCMKQYIFLGTFISILSSKT